MLDQLQAHVFRYLHALCTLEELESWLLSNLQSILDSGDAVAIEMANQIDADLIELGEGLIDDTTFHEHLVSYVNGTDTVVTAISDFQVGTIIEAGANVSTVKSFCGTPEPVAYNHEENPTPVADYALPGVPG